MNVRQAISIIERSGALLVYPLQNRAEPPSLWREFFPRTVMRWEWDDRADSRVAQLWHLRAKLAKGRAVVYTKWYAGRATFFSRKLFRALLTRMQQGVDLERDLSREARDVLEVLRIDSPMSSRRLREQVGLQGKLLESTWTRAQKELWSRLLIVGAGEVDDGAFPSLALAATQAVFEDLWDEAQTHDVVTANATIARYMSDQSQFGRYLQRVEKSLRASKRKD